MSLSPEQFQIFDPGPTPVTRKPLPPKFDPGPRALRGQARGQQIMNFDVPTAPLEVGGGYDPGSGASDRYLEAPPTVYVDEDTDPDFSDAIWSVGGYHRVSDDTERSKQVISTWESAPVENIPAEAELRSGQGDLDPWHAEELREAPRWDALPWVAEIQGKRYVAEGHHRVDAARHRGTGDLQAHVIHASSMNDLLKRFR